VVLPLKQGLKPKMTAQVTAAGGSVDRSGSWGQKLGTGKLLIFPAFLEVGDREVGYLVVNSFHPLAKYFLTSLKMI
jgi:hypothetical protein